MRKVKSYKTLRGMCKALEKRHGNIWQITVRDFFEGKIYSYPYYLRPSKELRDQMAEFFVNQTWRSGRAKKIRAIKENRGTDYSFFQCFFIEIDRRTYEPERISISLSGDAYDYCKRCFSNRIY